MVESAFVFKAEFGVSVLYGQACFKTMGRNLRRQAAPQPRNAQDGARTRLSTPRSLRIAASAAMASAELISGVIDR